jgi:hypothetical protein
MMLKRFMAWLKRNPCAECLYYNPENNTCNSKKAVTMGPGYVTWTDRLYCEPYKGVWL